MRTTLMLPVVFLVGCSLSRGGPAVDGGLHDGATSQPMTPFLRIDASIPTCMTASTARVVDAGPIPERDCGTGPSVSFQDDIRPLLAVHCTGEVCHEGSWASSPHEYEQLVLTPTPECCDGRKRIDPVHPDRSYLLEKLRGVDLCAGRPMPLSGSITPAQIDEIARWVCQGARAN